MKLDPTITQSDQSRKLPYGAYAKIARRLRPKVSIQHVRSVALGERRSARVERAIENFRRRLERAS